MRLSFIHSKSFLLGALVAAGMMAFAVPGVADTSFTARRMTRNDVPSGKGQCDIRLRVDNEVEMAIRGDRVEIRTIAGQDPTDAGSECNFPLPVGLISNFRWEKRDGRGRVELLEEPTPRSGNRAIFNIRDADGGAGRYHVRLNWDIQGSSNVPDSSTGRPSRPGRPGNSGWGNDSGWGSSSSGNSGWGNQNGWGNVAPPASLNQNGQGRVTWDRRAELTVTRANVRVNNDRAIIRIDTTANRTVEFRGRVTNSSAGFFEVELDGSSEGSLTGMARVDYRNQNTIERIDLYGNAGNDRFRVDFRR